MMSTSFLFNTTETANLLLQEEVLTAPPLQGPLVLEESLRGDDRQRVADPRHLVAAHVAPLLLLLRGEAAEAGLGILVHEEILTFRTRLAFCARRAVHGVVVQVLEEMKMKLDRSYSRPDKAINMNLHPQLCHPFVVRLLPLFLLHFLSFPLIPFPVQFFDSFVIVIMFN